MPAQLRNRQRPTTPTTHSLGPFLRNPEVSRLLRRAHLGFGTAATWHQGAVDVPRHLNASRDPSGHADSGRATRDEIGGVGCPHVWPLVADFTAHLPFPSLKHRPVGACSLEHSLLSLMDHQT